MSFKTVTPVQTSQGLNSHKADRRTLVASRFSQRVRLFSGLLLLALSASAVAQTRVCIGGEMDAMDSTEIAACQAKISSVKMAAQAQGAPADWHFVIVCDEAGWKDYSSFSKQQPGLLQGASYSTDTRLRWTFLRGSDLSAEEPQHITSLVSMALNTVPKQKPAPQFTSPRNATRQFGVASADRTSISPLAR